MCTGNRPDCWLSSILNSLTAGSNFMIPTSMGTRIVMRWGSCPRQTPRQIEAYVLGLRKQPVFVRRMQCPEGVQTRCLDDDDCRRIYLRWHNRILCCFFLTFATNVFFASTPEPDNPPPVRGRDVRGLGRHGGDCRLEHVRTKPAGPQKGHWSRQSLFGNNRHYREHYQDQGWNSSIGPYGLVP
jgi:hypothetical protein